MRMFYKGFEVSVVFEKKENGRCFYTITRTEDNWLMGSGAFSNKESTTSIATAVETAIDDYLKETNKGTIRGRI